MCICMYVCIYIQVTITYRTAIGSRRILNNVVDDMRQSSCPEQRKPETGMLLAATATQHHFQFLGHCATLTLALTLRFALSPSAAAAVAAPCAGVWVCVCVCALMVLFSDHLGLPSDRSQLTYVFIMFLLV